MKAHPIILVAIATLAFPTGLAAQESEASVSDSEQFQVIGTVPPLCSIGIPDNSGGVFDMGVLVDTTTGLLRTDLVAPNKILSDAFCASRSTIVIEASPMLAQNFAGTPAAGFANSIDYVASATGWTLIPASFNTAATSNPAATQSRNSAFTGNIAVGVSNFATTGGPSLRPVADDEYLGEITVTLTAVE
jgi:hypothetical protein